MSLFLPLQINDLSTPAIYLFQGKNSFLKLLVCSLKLKNRTKLIEKKLKRKMSEQKMSLSKHNIRLNRLR